MLGKEKHKKLTTRQLVGRVTRYETALASGQTFNARQTKTGSAAIAALTKRDPVKATTAIVKGVTAGTQIRAAAQQAAAPAGVVVPPVPSQTPPAGYQWTYDPTTNSYVPQLISVSGNTTGTTTGGGGGGGGGAADFTGYTNEPYGQFTTPGTNPAAAATPTVNPLDAALASVGAPTSGAGLKVALVAGAAVAVFMFLRKRGRGAA